MAACGRLSIEGKIEYFRQSDLFTRRTGSGEEAFDDDDSLDEEEKALRRKCRRFHAGSDIPVATPVYAPSQQPQSDRSPHSSQVSAQEKERPPRSGPKRVASAPLATTIQATPLSEHRRRAARTIATSTSFVAETPLAETPLAVPDSVAGPRRHHLLRRSETTPLPAKRGFFDPAKDCSPLVGLPMKKRKRSAAAAEVKLVPEADRVFAGLRFFYIPDDDVAPARRARIIKAREYGACWTREIGDATHVVVDRRLGYADIEGILGARPPPEEAVVVCEEFPLDCISYRQMLNPHQAKYQVAGYPGRACGAAESEPTAGRTVEKDDLVLKPPPANSKRWDHLPNVGTPSQDSEPSQQGAGSLGEPAKPLPQTIPMPDDDPQSQTAHVEPNQGRRSTPEDKAEPKQDTVGDELSEYINMMQKYRALPLDDEHDDDDHRSTSGTTTATSLSASDEGEDEHRSGSEAEAMPPKRAKKAIPLEERFACYQGGTLDAPSTSPNARTIEVLQEMCTYYSRTNDQWRTLSYRRAIKTLQRQSSRICTAEEARRLPGIGERLALKIEEIATTDRLQRLEHANAEPLDRALQLFLGVYDVGLSQASRWVAQGLRTLDDLLGPRVRLMRNQRIGVERYADLNARIPRREVEAVGEVVRAAAREIDPCVELIIGGSYRRGAETSGDVDFLITRPGTLSAADLAPFLATLVRDLEHSGFLVATLASSRSPGGGGGAGTIFRGCCALPAPHPPTWRRIDLLVVPDPELGAALIYFTGNDVFNRSMRLLASKKGMRLNQRGLYEGVMRDPGREKISEGRLVEGRDERRIFEVLGVRWREPWERWC